MEWGQIMNLLKQKPDMIIEKAKKGLCPICCLSVDADEKEEIATENYKGFEIRIHKRHVREKSEVLP